MHDALLGNSVSILGGLALVALGAFVLTVRPRLPPNVAFALFSFGFGGTFVVVGAGRLAHVDGSIASELVQTLFMVTWVGGLLGMAFLFPRRFMFSQWPLMLIAGLSWAVLLVVSFPVLVDSGAGESFLFRLRALVSSSALFAFLVLLTLRYRSAEDTKERRQFAIMTAALGLSIGIIATYGITGAEVDSVLYPMGPFVGLAWVRFVLMLGVVALWLVAMWGSDGNVARNVALFLLAVMLVGLIHSALRGSFPVSGLSRILMVLLLTYAVLRHQLLGVDVRVRWGVSKSVLAGLFVAVFFLVAELTKWYFEDRLDALPAPLDPTVLGIIAAALLLFAVSPLQRMADRFAERAVPHTEPGPGVSAERREESYKRVLKRFLADGEVSHEEERALAELAGDLGIDAGRAFALREEVESGTPQGKTGSGGD